MAVGDKSEARFSKRVFKSASACGVHGEKNLEVIFEKKKQTKFQVSSLLLVTIECVLFVFRNILATCVAVFFFFLFF